ncbi:Ornithine_decarboxylase [Hexamita inflata]|uniref:Ornithine_decarboxylase n=1 Tax=Hexamita inflata TaxID=28002 RepID=A0ABP1GLJ1_9EUKA
MKPSFVTLSLSKLKLQYELLLKTFPTAKVYYSVKCNPLPNVIKYLTEIGCSFDCASINEIKYAISFGCDAKTQIIFANPHCSQADIDEAVRVGVEMMTFDSEAQLLMMKNVAKPLLRLRPDSQSNQFVKLGLKFGTDSFEGQRLLNLAKAMKKDVVGIAFHMGYPIGPADQIMLMLSEVERLAAFNNLKLQYLDFGGGLMPSGVPIEDYAGVSQELLRIQRDNPGLEIQSEPGRYIVEDAIDFYTRVESVDKNRVFVAGSAVQSFHRDLLLSKKLTLSVVKAEELQKCVHSKKRIDIKVVEGGEDKIVIGSSGIRYDIFYEGKLGDVKAGDYIAVKNAGAYTASCLSDRLDLFSGMEPFQVVEID